MSYPAGQRISASDGKERPKSHEVSSRAPSAELHNDRRGHLLHLNWVHSLFVALMQAPASDFQFSPNFSIKIGLEAPGNVRAVSSFGGVL
jgi:hypothetical protein